MKIKTFSEFMIIDMDEAVNLWMELNSKITVKSIAINGVSHKTKEGKLMTEYIGTIIYYDQPFESFKDIGITRLKRYAIHPIQEKLSKLDKTHDLKHMTYREIGKEIGEEHPQKVKHHLIQAMKKGLIKNWNLVL